MQTLVPEKCEAVATYWNNRNNGEKILNLVTIWPGIVRPQNATCVG